MHNQPDAIIYEAVTRRYWTHQKRYTGKELSPLYDGCGFPFLFRAVQVGTNGLEDTLKIVGLKQMARYETRQILKRDYECRQIVVDDLPEFVSPKTQYRHSRCDNDLL